MADTLKIVCNNQARDVLHWWNLADKERAEFDYLDTDDKQSEASFMRYRGWVYDLSEFMRIDKAIAPHPQRPGWERFDGHHGDSYFSGVLIRYTNDFESVVAATYYA